MATRTDTPHLSLLNLARELCPDPSITQTLQSLAWCLGLADAGPTPRLQAVLQAWQAVRAALGQTPALCYLAGPVRGDGSRAGMRHNQTRMLRLARWAQAVLPQASLFVPHGNFAYLDESRDPDGQVRKLAMRGCEQFLSRADAVILCADELSPGMRREQELAGQLGIPAWRVPGWDPVRGRAEDRDDGAA